MSFCWSVLMSVGSRGSLHGGFKPFWPDLV